MNLPLQVNQEAKKIRHQKLFQHLPTWRKLYYRLRKKRVQSIPVSSLEQSNPSVSPKASFENLRRQLFWKLTSFSLAFFLIQGVVPSYAYTEAKNDWWASEELALTENEYTGLQEDGFIFTLSGQSEVGDRSSMSQVVEYEVQAGDTLSSLSQKFHISQQTIVWNNNLSANAALKIGHKLFILPVDGVLHTVQKGENISSIAKKYKLDKAEIITRQNNLDEATLAVNQKIIVPGATIQVPRDYIAYNRGDIRNTTDKARVAQFEGTIQPGGFIKPTNGIYTTYFKSGHYGVDIANRSKGPIFAAADGVVQRADKGWNGGYGNMIVLEHSDLDATTLYGHMSELYVKAGDSVKQGDVIGWMGNTGRVYGSTGIHLHFEVAIDGRKRNPLSFF